MELTKGRESVSATFTFFVTLGSLQPSEAGRIALQMLVTTT